MWLKAIGIAALLVVVFALGWSARPSPTPDTGYSRVDVPWVTSQDRVHAMMSIYAHTRWHDDDRRLAHFLSLQRAVEILRSDHGPAADSRRRRAIAQLATYGLGQREFDEAIESLGGNLDSLSMFKAQLSTDITAYRAEIQFVNFLSFITPYCQWMAQANTSGGPGDADSPGWRYEVLVPREMTAVARALDPQSWAQCSDFFFDSYLVDTPTSCCPNDKDSDCSYAVDGSSSPEPDDPPQPRGKGYGHHAFFERFCHDGAEDCPVCLDASAKCDIYFENLLCVNPVYDPPKLFQFTAASADEYSVGFGLAKAIFGEIDGNDSEPPNESAVLVDDHGYLAVEDSAGPSSSAVPPWSKVTVKKALRMQSASESAAVGAMLEAFDAELRGQVAEQVCCSVAEEPWTPLDRLFQNALVLDWPLRKR
jgi:hypothetical protein